MRVWCCSPVVVVHLVWKLDVKQPGMVMRSAGWRRCCQQGCTHVPGFTTQCQWRRVKNEANLDLCGWLSRQTLTVSVDSCWTYRWLLTGGVRARLDIFETVAGKDFFSLNRLVTLSRRLHNSRTLLCMGFVYKDRYTLSCLQYNWYRLPWKSDMV